ncbi:transposase, partial [Clostridiaceae bacterium TF01-6]
CCGKIKHDLKLEERVYLCNCGNRMDRDENAAVNICREGLRISGIILEKSEKAS